MALVRSVVHVECDSGMQEVPFFIKVWGNFFPFHHLDIIYQYISSYDNYLLHLDYYILLIKN